MMGMGMGMLGEIRNEYKRKEEQSHVGRSENASLETSWKVSTLQIP